MEKAKKILKQPYPLAVLKIGQRSDLTSKESITLLDNHILPPDVVLIYASQSLQSQAKCSKAWKLSYLSDYLQTTRRTSG